MSPKEEALIPKLSPKEKKNLEKAHKEWNNRVIPPEIDPEDNL